MSLRSDDPAFRGALRWATVGELSCRVAHESNNLLAGVLGQAEIALLSKDPSRMKAALESILKSARELKTVNERLGRFSRGVEPVLRNTNVLEIFRELFSLLERSFRKAGIEVRHAYGSGLPMTWCEPGGSSQVLLFALRLALEALAGAGGGLVILEGCLGNGQLVFGVQFEPPPGKELDKAPASAGALIFELAASLAEEQSGSLRLDRAGRGWQLTCRFPIRGLPDRMPADRAKLQSPPAAPEASQRASALSVLVVDDEGPIRDVLQEDRKSVV